ncbi:MAG: 3-hydroxylacyl-ACP dehydratase [Myxococcota bacterium]
MPGSPISGSPPSGSPGSGSPDSDWPPPGQLIPHAGAMVLLSRVRAHDESRTVCEIDVDALPLFRDERGCVPAWLGLEFMAQCVAAHAGLVGRLAGEPPKIGLLVGSRRVRFHRAMYTAGQCLSVSARRTWGQDSGLVAFECAIDDARTDERLAEGRLNCFMPKDAADLEDIL